MIVLKYGRGSSEGKYQDRAFGRTSSNDYRSLVNMQDFMDSEVDDAVEARSISSCPRVRIIDIAGMEKLFLAAAEKGDKKAILYALDNAPDLNINCVDREGRSALIIAINNGNSDIIKVLLEHGIQLGDSLLRSVDEQFTLGVQLICEHIKRKNLPEYLNCRALNGDFHPDVTPIVLAAHHNNYDIIRNLLEYGVRIDDPEDYAFHTEVNTLQNCLGTLNIYKGLASPAYISLTSSDPINTAFERCVQLRKLSEKNHEFSAEFRDLAEKCEQFAADILGHIRDSKEQKCILNHDPWGEELEDMTNSVAPYKVKIAINFEQRKFVAHPHCQQCLTQIWYEDLPAWFDYHWSASLAFTVLIALFFPVLCTAYAIYPYGQIRSFMRVPYVQFVCHSSSNVLFLLLLGMQSMPNNDQVDEMTPTPTLWEWCIVAWVIGLTWVEIKEIWYYGLRYTKDRWNLMDFVMLSLYWGAIVLRVVIHFQNTEDIIIPTNATIVTDTATASFLGTTDDFDYTSSGGTTLTTPYMTDNPLEVIQDKIDDLNKQVESLKNDQSEFNRGVNSSLYEMDVMLKTLDEKIDELSESVKSLSTSDTSSGGSTSIGRRNKGGNKETAKQIQAEGRAKWEAFNPILVSEALFAIAKVLSLLRPICLTVMNRHVGPMQISLGGMMLDILKFLLIFSFVWFAFSIGMYQLYWYYSDQDLLSCSGSGSDGCFSPFKTLLNTMATLFWALFGLPDVDILRLHRDVNHEFTESVATLLYAAYHIIAIVVLLNVLIAMMSSTYTRVEEDADMQWKFSRSKLWMSYFEGRGTVPPPFNVIPTLKTGWYIVNYIREKVCMQKARKKKMERNKVFMEEKQRVYQEIIGKLVSRYIFDAKRDDDEGNQDQWINQLKEDISSFKYEMFEALTEMDSRMKDMETQIREGSNSDDRVIGTGFYHAMQDVIKPLSRPDSLQSVQSGVSDACAIISKDLKDSKTPLWADGEFGEMLTPLAIHRKKVKPKSPSMPANIGGFQIPEEWERFEPIRFIDDEYEAHLKSTYRHSSSKRRRHSVNNINHNSVRANNTRNSKKMNHTSRV
ncbi:short transient receptor potential channel 4-like [Antedon mediterranea]|uniref:short transient receptor potential channel 4-like n=1 Tax=Antedon mediterranea TaxID=105859 RepID=UPI003AF8C98A